MTYKLKWYERIQIEIGIRWQLCPHKDITWKKWLFDPYFRIILPNQEIKNRWQLPESTSFGVDSYSLKEGNDKKFYSAVLWIYGAVRILGFDVGIGFFWRTRKVIEK